jgi:hypothetical protein
MKFISLITIACLISLTIQTTVTSTTTVTLPAVGQYVFTPYSDNKCTVPHTTTEKVGIFTSASTCWGTGTTSSVTPTAWNGTTMVLSVSLYTTAANCMGTMASATLPADGSCIASAFQSNLWMSLVYINLPTTATFTFAPFKDTVCAVSDGTAGVYTAKSLCWVVSSTSSMVPLRWVSNTKRLALYAYMNSSTCKNTVSSTLQAVVGEIVCDGTCLKSFSNSYYTCNVMDTAVVTTNSRFLTMGLVAVLCFLAIFV